MNELLSLSSYSFGLYSLPTLATAIGMLILGGAVVMSEQRARVSLAFGFLSIALMVWLGAFSMMYASVHESIAMFWARAAYLGIPFIPAAVYVFTVEVLGLRATRTVPLKVAVLSATAFAALIIPTDLLFRELYRYPWGYYPRYRAFAALYLGYFLGFLALSMWELLRAWRTTLPRIQLKRVRSFTLAFALGYFALIDYLPSFGISLYPFGYLAIFAFLVISAWTVRRYRLRDLTPSFAAEEIVDTMADSLIVLDARRMIRVVNRAALKVLRYPRQGLLHQPADILTGESTSEADRLREALSEPIVRDRAMEFLDSEGSPVAVSVSISHLTDEFGDPAGSVLIARDIRERMRVEGELAQVRRKLAQSRERERMHLAQELHDGPLQALHGLDFQVGELARDPAVDGTAPKLRELRTSLQRVARALRAISGELRPPALAPFGLESAIRSHALTVQQRHPELEFVLNLENDQQLLPHSIRIALFRIFQQAIDNAIQHAHANRLRIWFSLSVGELVLEIEDNGSGFTPPSRWVDLVESGHLGLVGAIERAETIGGRLDIISSPGQGTVIKATAPLPSAEASHGGPA